MEYYRTIDGQIQADLARRLGIVLRQYHQKIDSSEKYEVSLSLSILQTLLTNCVELLNKIPKREKGNNPIYHSPISSEIWGFDKKNIISSTFKQPNLNADIVFRHIRNALSHPTSLDLNSNFKTTGYTTRVVSSTIESIVFVSSKDLNNKGNHKIHESFELAERLRNEEGNFPDDVEITKDINGKFIFTRSGKIFHRIFEIEFAPTNLLTLAYSLSNYLSHPLKKNWDGITFEIQKIAA